MFLPELFGFYIYISLLFYVHVVIFIFVSWCVFFYENKPCCLTSGVDVGFFSVLWVCFHRKAGEGLHKEGAMGQDASLQNA